MGTTRVTPAGARARPVPRRIMATSLLLVLALLAAGCTTTPAAGPDGATTSAPPDPAAAAERYAVLEAAARAFDFTAVDALRAAFTSLPDFIERVTRLSELEEQAFAQLEQPLRLGAIGNALLQSYPGSLMGHAALVRYYERVGDAGAERHRAAADAIADAITRGAPGSVEAPRRVLSGGEARAWLWYRGETILGTVYIVPDADSLRLAAAVAPAEPGKPIETRMFDLTSTYGRLADRVAGNARSQADDTVHGAVRSHELVRYFAERGDTAAITWIGIGLATQGGAQLRPGIAWLERAAATGNLFARVALARAHFNLRQSESSEEAKRSALENAVGHWRSAIASGSEDAMLDLAGVYLNDLLGEGGTEEGLRLLRQAGDLGNTRALLALAALYRDGVRVEQDQAQALALMARAAGHGSDDAKLQYVRTQLAATPPALDGAGRAWLAELVTDEVPFALYVDATLRAKGEVFRRDVRTARRQMLRAAERTEDPELLNNIAWTLAVAPERGLRDARRAVALMDKVMADEAHAANPAYLDTWAAAHASAGRFERAVEIQRKAVDAARERRSDVLGVLEQHLELFQRREPVREPLP
jgi:TPR repeat protein